MTLAPPSLRPAPDAGGVVGDGTTLRIRTRSRWQSAR